MVASVGVVIVTYNSAPMIADLLASLPEALGDLSAEVVVVDNGSSDGTADLVEALGGAAVVRSTNRGYAAGINLGVDHLPVTDSILVLNPDTRLAPASVEMLYRTLHVEGIGITVPQVRGADGALQLSLRREQSLLRACGLTQTRLPIFSEYLAQPSDYDHPRTVDWALGAVMLLERRCFDVLNGWDESFFLYSEETDFCLRARDIGFLTRYVPDAVAEHVGGQSGQSARTHVMQIVNRVRLYRRRRGPIAGWLYYALTVLSEATNIRKDKTRHRAAVVALLRPSRRPPELNCSNRLVPI